MKFATENAAQNDEKFDVAVKSLKTGITGIIHRCLSVLSPLVFLCLVLRNFPRSYHRQADNGYTPSLRQIDPIFIPMSFRLPLPASNKCPHYSPTHLCMLDNSPLIAVTLDLCRRTLCVPPIQYLVVVTCSMYLRQQQESTATLSRAQVNSLLCGLFFNLWHGLENPDGVVTNEFDVATLLCQNAGTASDGL